MRPVAFGEALTAGTRLTLLSDDKPDRFFTVIKFWMDETSGIALALKSYQLLHKLIDEMVPRLEKSERMWELEALMISTREPMVVIEEAIGIYSQDQNKARWRTWNLFFWITLLIESIVGVLFNVVTLFGGNAQKARDSAIGRIVSATGMFLGWDAAVATILWFLGFQTAIQHLLHLS